MKAEADDVSMTRVRAWVEESKLTLHDLGVRMGFDEKVARQSAFQFLKSKNPQIRPLRRFAKAAGSNQLTAEPESRPETLKRIKPIQNVSRGQTVAKPRQGSGINLRHEDR